MLMNAINFVMDAGSSVFMPLIIMTLGLIFGLKFPKAFRAGIVVGISDLKDDGFVNPQYFMVTSCTHTFNNNEHTMSLDLQVSV